MDGGVIEPLVGVMLMAWLPPSLEPSVERSVRKLAFDRRRSSLRLKMDGAMRYRTQSLTMTLLLTVDTVEPKWLVPDSAKAHVVRDCFDE